MQAKDIKLTAEEQEIADSFEAGEWQPVADREAEANRYRQIARATSGNVNGRLVDHR